MRGPMRQFKISREKVHPIADRDWWMTYLVKVLASREYVRLRKINKRVRLERIFDELTTGTKVVGKWVEKRRSTK